MKTHSDTKITADPKAFAEQKYPATFLYQLLIDEGVAPVTWKGEPHGPGKAPKGRDATVKDLDTTAALRITGNTIEAMW